VWQSHRWARRPFVEAVAALEAQGGALAAAAPAAQEAETSAGEAEEVEASAGRVAAVVAEEGPELEQSVSLLARTLVAREAVALMGASARGVEMDLPIGRSEWGAAGAGAQVALRVAGVVVAVAGLAEEAPKVEGGDRVDWTEEAEWGANAD